MINWSTYHLITFLTIYFSTVSEMWVISTEMAHNSRFIWGIQLFEGLRAKINPFSLTYVSGSFGGSVCSWFWDFVGGWRTLLTRSVIPLKGNHLYEQADSATQYVVDKSASSRHTRQYHDDNCSAATVHSWGTHIKDTACTAIRTTRTERKKEREKDSDRLDSTAHGPSHNHV